jgi:hypothetical protein
MDEEWLEYSNEQRRQLVDVIQAFHVFREASRRFQQSYRGTMRWRSSKGKQYLYRTVSRHGVVRANSLGPRTATTESILREFKKGKDSLSVRLEKTEARLAEMARVNRALRLHRVPVIETKILRALDREGLLGAPLFIVGTNALYAYESRAGVFLNSSLVATRDMDLLWDDRRTMSLVLAEEAAQRGVLGVLRSVDPSFSLTGPRSFRAANDDGYLVDLIRPLGRGPFARKSTSQGNRTDRIGPTEDDLYGVGIEGIDWLIHSPKIEEVVIGSDGFPLFVSCIDPRVFALHKWWLSRRADRNPKQRPRDASQALTVANLCLRYLGQSLDSPDLSALPESLRAQAKTLIAQAAS